jgi:hypothetical protein
MEIQKRSPAVHKNFLSKYPRILPLFVLVAIPIWLTISGFLLFENLRHSTKILVTLVPYENLDLGHFPCFQIYNTTTHEHHASYNYFTGDLLYQMVLDAQSKSSTIVTDKYFVNVTLVPFFVVSLFYAFYPLKFRADEYHKKRGLREVVIEYEFVKKILCIEIPLLLIFTLTNFYVQLVDVFRTDLLLFVYVAQMALQYSVTAGILWLLLQMARKEFRYYMARAYIKCIPDNYDDVRKLRWLIMALNSYNKYLLRNLKLQIDNLKVYSTLLIANIGTYKVIVRILR